MTIVIPVDEVARGILQAPWRLPVNRELDRLRQCNRDSWREFHLVNRCVVSRRPNVPIAALLAAEFVSLTV